MKNSLIVILILIIPVLAKADDSLAFKEKWRECKMDTDCTAVEYGFLPVNKIYQDKMKKYIQTVGLTIDYDKPPSTNWNPVLKCSNNLCEILKE